MVECDAIPARLVCGAKYDEGRGGGGEMQGENLVPNGLCECSQNELLNLERFKHLY